MSAIRLENINKTYNPNLNNETQVVFDVSLKINQGEFIVIVGPSGCGKSTLLRMLAGLEVITSGQLKINNTPANDTPAQDRDIAFVFQNYALYPHLNVRDNIAFSLELRKVGKAERHIRAAEVAEMLRLTPYLDKKPGQLSGGQRQRVAMGRAIARDAHIFLMDEPLSNLDAELRNSMRAQIKTLHKRLGNTTVYVTHDQVEALTLADKIAVMKDGVLQQFATPEDIYDKPKNVFVASFIGSPAMNILPLTLSESNHPILAEQEQLLPLKEPSNVKPIMGEDQNNRLSRLSAGEYLLGVRPDKIALVDANTVDNYDFTLMVKVNLVETTGSQRTVHCKIDKQKILVSIDRAHKIAEGAEIQIAFNQSDILLFDKTTEMRID